MANEVAVPYIDPDVEHVGVSRLRKLNKSNLRRQKTLVIQDADTPVAVLLSYGQFLAMQTEMESLMATVELLSDDEERELLAKGLDQVKAGTDPKPSGDQAVIETDKETDRTLRPDADGWSGI